MRNSYNVQNVSFSPDGKILASGSDDFKIKLWNITNGTLLQTLNSHQGRVLRNENLITLASAK